MNQSNENNLAVNVPTTNAQGGGRITGTKAPAQVSRTRKPLSELNQGLAAFPHVNPKGMKGNNVVSKKNPPVFPVNRPITRRFAAEIASKQPQSCPMDTGKQHTSDSNSSETEMFIYVDEEESSAREESKTPMPVDEEVLDEMEEDEIDPIRKNIDEGDEGNPLAVVEYVEEIYAYYKNVENNSCVPPNYMDQQIDINGKMRAVLIDWLIEVHFKFDLMDETLFLMVNLIDRFLAVKTIERKKLQLVGVTALLLAGKYEEVSFVELDNLVAITDGAYTIDELIGMERLMVNTLQFNLSLPTPYVFMRRFLKVVQSTRQLDLLSFFLIELCLVEYEMVKYPPSLLAAAAIFTAQCTIYKIKNWDSTSEWHTTYSEAQLMECAKKIVRFHQNAATGRQTAVFRKYGYPGRKDVQTLHRKYGYPASSEAAMFLLEE